MYIKIKHWHKRVFCSKPSLWPPCPSSSCRCPVNPRTLPAITCCPNATHPIGLRSNPVSWIMDAFFLHHNQKELLPSSLSSWPTASSTSVAFSKYAMWSSYLWTFYFFPRVPLTFKRGWAQDSCTNTQYCLWQWFEWSTFERHAS